jgi:release factor glutamine methyltransferase
MPPPEWTILSILEWTTGYFRQNQIDTPRLDAEILLAHSLGLKRIDLYLRYDQPLDAAELAAFKMVVKRRAAREPVAYIIGRREFWGLDLVVDANVLTPRPETERLVEVALTFLQTVASPWVVDLGTGSGCIALALAHDAPSARVIATDVSLPALRVARRNIDHHHMAERIQLVAGAGLTMFPPDCAHFDLIVANPPYIASAEIESLQPEVRDYEPRGALDGGDDGIAAYRRIIPAAANRLHSGGALILEIGWDQGPAVTRLSEHSGFYRDCQCIADDSGRDRVMAMTRI